MKAEFFARNRRELIQKLDGGSAVLTAYTATQQSGDAASEFVQEANFWYLSGIEKPDWWLIIDGARAKSWLVTPKRSAIHEIFDGTLPPETAQHISGVDGVLSQHDAEMMLRDMSRTHPLIYTLGRPRDAEYYDFVLNPAPLKMKQQLERLFRDVHDCTLHLAKLRAIKQPEEISAIKRAVALTNDAFNDVKRTLDTRHYEYEVEADFTFQFRRHNATHAYEPIVAAGSNACTLHYIENSSRLKKGDLLLCDVGARCGGYAADVTRTFAYGEPSKRAAKIHHAVVAAQAEIVALIEPGAPIADYLREADEIMKRAMAALGLIESPNDTDGFRRYMPHSIGHGLGIDVHDSLGAPRIFEPGMVMTVEPGIYVPETGIGVRIEDDILVTERGRENLSADLEHTW